MTAIAFAGSGWVTAIHGLAAAGVRDLRVVHVASRSPRAARRRASQVGAVACTYADLPGGAEAVVVATPPAENLVHAPAVAEAVRAVRRLGTLTFLEVRLAQGQPDRRGHLRPQWGGGVLFDLGVHAVALAMLLAAPARGGRGGARLAPAEAGAARLDLVPEPAVELNGAPIRLPDAPDDLSSPQLYYLGYTPQLAALAADVAANRAPRTSAALGRTVLDVVCAAYVAAGRGRPEPLPFAGPRDRTPHQLWQDAVEEAARAAAGDGTDV